MKNTPKDKKKKTWKDMSRPFIKEGIEIENKLWINIHLKIKEGSQNLNFLCIILQNQK